MQRVRGGAASWNGDAVTVYAVQEPCIKVDGKWQPKIDIQTASDFGDVVTLVPASHTRAALVTQPTLAGFRRALQDFCDDDYILPVGDITLVAMAVAVAASINRGRVKLLRWSREDKRYDVVDMDLHAATRRATDGE